MNGVAIVPDEPIINFIGDDVSGANDGGANRNNVTIRGQWNGTTTPAALTASVNNYNPPDLATRSYLRMSADALGPWNVTGLAAQPANSIRTLVNIGANPFNITNLDGGSAAANQFRTVLGNIQLAQDESATFRYDGVTLCWRLLCLVRGTVIVDVFSAPAGGTWTKRPGLMFIDVYIIGPGGGGGSGRRGATNTVRTAGGSGAGGSAAYQRIQESALGATETVTVPAGGTGGAAIGANDTNGNPGSVTVDATFGAHIRGARGSSGNGGTTAAASRGTRSVVGWNFGMGGCGLDSSNTGGAGGNVPATPAWDNPTTGAAATGFGAGAGATGGGITNGNGTSVGGTGGNGSFARPTPLAGGAGGSGATAGADGASAPAGEFCGGAGGGGGASDGAGRNGGKGGFPGGGGGSGAASLNGTASGAGGDGGAALCIVYNYFR